MRISLEYQIRRNLTKVMPGHWFPLPGYIVVFTCTMEISICTTNILHQYVRSFSIVHSISIYKQYKIHSWCVAVANEAMQYTSASNILSYDINYSHNSFYVYVSRFGCHLDLIGFMSFTVH